VSGAAEVAVLVLTGFVSATVNMVSAGGSFLTLPILIFLGLPPGVANATNRVGVAAQNLVGAYGFHAHGVIEWPVVRRAVVPCALGAVAGSYTSLLVGDHDLRRILAVVMVLMSLFAVLDPGRLRPRGARAQWLVVTLASVGAGFYGGFLQAGVGFLILAVSSLGGLDLVRGTGVKVFLLLVQTGLSVAVYSWAGTIAWGAGLALAAGCCLGSVVGVRLTVTKGHDWLKRVVTATILVFAAILWFGP
jgi:hypothetical protein